MSDKKLSSIITGVVLLVIVAVFIVVWGVYSDWFDTSFQQFFVSSGKTKFLQPQNVLLGDVEFKVNFVFLGKSDYVVRILPTGTDFHFSVNGAEMSFLQLKDLTPAFGVKQSGNWFVVRAKEMSMQRVLEALYPGSTIEIAALDVDATEHFQLVVSAGERTAPILSFRAFGELTDIEIDPDHVFA